MPAAPKGKHIVVVGAGVIGLQTAISLLEAGYDVTVIAKHIPGDMDIEYTSPWAGAQWRTHAGDDDKEAQEWDIESYNTWLRMLEEEGTDVSHKTGLAKFEAVEYTWTPPSTPPPLPWYAPHVRNFRSLYTAPTATISTDKTAAATPAPTPTPTHTYTSVTLTPSLYLPHLVRTLTSHGGRLLQHTLPTPLIPALRSIPSLLSQHPNPSAIVLSPGLAAKTLIPDPALYPIRGQTVLVSGVPARMHAVPVLSPTDATPTYAIPRPALGTTVLGGIRGVPEDWRAEPDPKIREGILERCAPLLPELLTAPAGGFEVVGEGVGLRPGRIGGLRLEIEVVRDGDQGQGQVREWVVCHAYGHAGAGYQNSFGSAGKVVRLLGAWFEDEEKNKSKGKEGEGEGEDGRAKL